MQIFRLLTYSSSASSGPSRLTGPNFFHHYSARRHNNNNIFVLNRHFYRLYAENFQKSGEILTKSDKLPARIDVLICGGGLLGASVAMHLAKRGGQSVLVLEQGRIGGGGTWLSNGLASGHQLWQQQLRPLANYSNKLYKEMCTKYPDIDYKTCGRLFLARSDFSLVDIQRVHSLSQAYGYQSKVITTDETKQYCSFLNTADIQAGVLLYDDARVNSLALCIAMMKEAVNSGANVIENCRINSLKVNDKNFIYAVDTDNGQIECKTFVNAAGLWATRIPVDSKNTVDLKVNIPSQPCFFHYLLVKPFQGITSDMHVIHDLDSNVFVYPHDENTVICGGFDEQACKALLLDNTGSLPRDLNYQKLPEDWDLFLPIMEKLAHRFPSIIDSTPEQLVTTAESFTPDNYVLVGQVPNINNYYVATGMNSFGTTLAGGVGKLLSDWVIDGVPSQDVSKIDVARFLRAHSNQQYLKNRVPEVVALSYILLGHTNQYSNARFLRASPIHQHLRLAGAVFGEIMGYERPLYFATDRECPSPAVGEDFPFGKPIWYNYVMNEYQSCRERVAIMDMSNFSKFIITGPPDEVVSFLQNVCSADIDKPVGSTIFSGMQHEKGGYVTDCTLNRMATNEYFMVAPTVQQVRVKMWMRRHVPPKSGVVIQDVTSMFTALNIVGPLSRHLLQDLTDSKMGASDFPAFSCREINVGCASNIKAVSITHCGELGWVLYVPNEFAMHVYKQIVDAGKSYGIQHAGYYTLRQLRIEKFYVYWGMDIDWTTTPTQCGRIFRVDFNKEFIGKQALLAEKKAGIKRRYVQLQLDKHNLHKDPWPQGCEPIFRNGKYCGLTTTAAYGFTLNSQVCLGYVRRYSDDTGEEQYVTEDYLLAKNAAYEVDLCGRKFPAKIFLHSQNLPMTSSEQPTHYRPTQ